MHRFNGWRLFFGGALKPCHNHWVMHPRSLGAIWKPQFSKDVPGTVYCFYGNYLSSIKNLLTRIADLTTRGTCSVPTDAAQICPWSN